MQDTLSALFQKSKGQSISLDGRVVEPIFTRQINETNQKIRIRRISSSGNTKSGVRLKVSSGEIQINGENFKEIILWAETSPDDLELTIVSKKGCELKVWNVWQVDDLVQAWVGNAGICITESDYSTILECSNGLGKVDFTDYVIQIDYYQNDLTTQEE
jgi:hypothetical protein